MGNSGCFNWDPDIWWFMKESQHTWVGNVIPYIRKTTMCFLFIGSYVTMQWWSHGDGVKIFPLEISNERTHCPRKNLSILRALHRNLLWLSVPTAGGRGTPWDKTQNFQSHWDNPKRCKISHRVFIMFEPPFWDCFIFLAKLYNISPT